MIYTYRLPLVLQNDGLNNALVADRMRQFFQRFGDMSLRG